MPLVFKTGALNHSATHPRVLLDGATLAVNGSASREAAGAAASPVDRRLVLQGLQREEHGRHGKAIQGQRGCVA